MNTLVWTDETIDDLYDHWITLAENGNKSGLVKDIYAGLNGHGRAHEWEDGELVYIGPDLDTQDMTMLFMSYGGDAQHIIDMVDDSPNHDIGENLK